MMKMASGDGFPLWQGAGTGSRLVVVATEVCGGGTPDLGLFLEVSIFIRIFGVGNKSRGAMRRRQTRGARPRGRFPGLWWPRDSSGPTPMLPGLLLVHKKSS